MTKQEFFKLCNNFDYYYGYSDDHKVWKAGQAQSALISAYKADHPEIHKAFVAYWTADADDKTTPYPKLEDF